MTLCSQEAQGEAVGASDARAWHGVGVARALSASLAQAAFRVYSFFFCFARGSRDLGTPT
jgi:hypothetical protein